MLRVSRIDTFYGRARILFGMDLEVNHGELVALMGRNGMGKTTTVRSIMGLTPIHSGTVEFDGTAIHRLPPYLVARKGIGLVPEGRQVFPGLTTRENLTATATSGPWTLDRVFALFPHLERRSALSAGLLSGGEQQMLAIGRALMTNPRLLILDEAAEGLAPKIRAFIWSVLARLKADGLSILVIDKNVDALSAICDRVVIMEKGRAVWTGTGGDLREQPEVRREWLGV